MPNNEPKPEPKRSAKREKVEKSSSTLASALEPRVWIYFLFLLIFSGVTALFRPYVGLAEAAATLLLFCIYNSPPVPASRRWSATSPPPERIWARRATT